MLRNRSKKQLNIILKEDRESYSELGCSFLNKNKFWPLYNVILFTEYTLQSNNFVSAQCNNK